MADRPTIRHRTEGGSLQLNPAYTAWAAHRGRTSVVYLAHVDLWIVTDHHTGRHYPASTLPEAHTTATHVADTGAWTRALTRTWSRP